MEHNNLLLDAIRKELNSIIEDSAGDESPPASDDLLKPNLKPKKNSSNPSVSGAFKPSGTAKSPSPVVHKSEPPKCPAPATAAAISEPPLTVADIEEKLPIALSPFLESQATPGIDIDLQNMCNELQNSYQLFQSISTKFDSINFGTLKTRIRNLQMTNKQDTDLRDDIKDMVQQSYLNNKLGSLTSEMGARFKEHPGEFGDIPELSEFFKACAQLQHGLDALKRQRDEANQLGKRMYRAASASYDRINEIRSGMTKY